MAQRLAVTKTYKLFIGGKFPRSESGRSLPVDDRRGQSIAHLCRASRKDLRDSVSAARKALAGWSGATSYLRGQILYRMGEMLEGKREEVAQALASTVDGGIRRARAEVDASIDRLVSYAGWTDKYQHVLGCQNPVTGPYYNFTVPQATGVCAVIAPDAEPLLGLVSLLAPVMCAGGTAIVLASEEHPLSAALFGEVCATSDVPGGVVNVLTGFREELCEHIVSHRDIDAIHAADVDDETHELLRSGAAENLKRVTLREDVDFYDAAACSSPWWIEPFVEMKTIWHPSAT